MKKYNIILLLIDGARIDRLDKLNFSWDPYDEAWEKGFNYLKIYFEENGHTKVSNIFKKVSHFERHSRSTRMKLLHVLKISNDFMGTPFCKE